MATWLGAYAQNTSTNNNTWTNVPFGDDADDRTITLAVFTQRTGPTGGSQLSSVTIGGVAATELAYLPSSPVGLAWSLWQAEVPTGASGNVTLTSAVNCFRWGGFYRTTGLISGLVDAAYSNGAASTASTVNIDVQSGGIVVAGAIEPQSGAGSFTWSGDVIDASDEDFDGLLFTDLQVSWASKAKVVGGSSLAVTATNASQQFVRLGAFSLR